MPPKTKFSKEAIIDAAFDIAKLEGIDSITVRKVAEKLGSSTAPIYVNFTEIEELKQAVLVRIHNIAQQMLKTQYSSDPFLNIGIASIKFAREYSVLFKDLIMNSNRYLKNIQPSRINTFEQMKESTSLSVFSEEELAEILFKMQVFQLGLSVMDVNGLLPDDFDEEKIIQMLNSVGKDVIMATRYRKGEIK
ncbi:MULTISPECIES: TetR/AcrR family transcriptional regulator [Lysinibacillus]|uniref:TetR/AcrR family transcriptional regulator n=1 Tax=Lysinibacillus antri TaxID=2498145 RepID=A0A3S0RJ75_9BACI|nr:MULTISPECIES: TetR family transcriptional regulator [Lysinibacillus]RUL52159.1 TetR/AcrR family transcriptional regulator [Lysinibacillus antri]TSI05263.1 TetR/AcrR family transcriptional regulator [Lysinibacillus sp. BW-2-10]